MGQTRQRKTRKEASEKMTMPPFLITILCAFGIFAAFQIGMLLGAYLVWNIRIERITYADDEFDPDPDDGIEPIPENNVVEFRKRA